MISASDLTPAELAALLHFHADAGVDWLLEDEPVDRFAEFEAMRAARQGSRATQPRAEAPAPAPRSQPERRPAAKAATPSAPRATPAIPDEQAVEQARSAAESARSLSELKTAIEAFNGCNLKNSARSTIFASGTPEGRIMVIGPMPSADDDREGAVCWPRGAAARPNACRHRPAARWDPADQRHSVAAAGQPRPFSG